MPHKKNTKIEITLWNKKKNLFDVFKYEMKKKISYFVLISVIDHIYTKLMFIILIIWFILTLNFISNPNPKGNYIWSTNQILTRIAMIKFFSWVVEPNPGSRCNKKVGKVGKVI